MRTKSYAHGTRALCVIMSIVLATSGLLTGYSQARALDSSAEEASIVAADSTAQDSALHVAYRRDGSYTVSFAEKDLHAQATQDTTQPNADDATATVAATSDTSAADATATPASVTTASAKSFADLTADDVKVRYDAPADSATADDDSNAPTRESRDAAVTDLQNDGTTVTLSFTDPDAAANATGSYEIDVIPLSDATQVKVDFEDHTLTPSVAEVPDDTQGFDITLTLAAGSFASDLTIDQVSLGQAFENMTVQSMSVDGGTLSLSLVGSPVLDEGGELYDAGQITVAATGIQNATRDESVHIALTHESAVASAKSDSATSSAAASDDAASNGTTDAASATTDGTSATADAANDASADTTNGADATSTAASDTANNDSTSAGGAATGADDAADEVDASKAAPVMLVASQVVDPAASEAMIRIESPDTDIAPTLDASTIQLADAFESCELKSVLRVSKNEAQVLVGGTLANGDTGTISLAEGSFTDPKATGTVHVGIAHEDATIVDTQNSMTNGAFTLSINTGSAQLSEAFGTADVSLPANGDIRITGAEHEAYDNSVAITVEAPGEIAYDQFKALDDALTQGGVRLQNTTVGEVVAHAATDESTGRTSALSYVAPQLTAYIERGADGKGYELAGDGSATIKLRVRIVSTGGDVNLTNSTITFDDQDLAPTNKQVDADSTYQAELTVETLTKDQIDQLMSQMGYANAEELLDAQTYTDASRMAEGLSVAGGVTNSWGIELPASEPVHAEAFNLAGLGETGKTDEQKSDEEHVDSAAVEVAGEVSELSAVGANALANLVVANNVVQPDQVSYMSTSSSRAKTMSDAFKYTAEALKLIGSVAASAAAGNPGAAVSGVGSLLTFIGTSVAPTSWSINDVMNQVLALDARLDTVSAQLGGIESQLQKLSSELDYKTQVGNLTTLAEQGLRYRTPVIKMLREVKNASDRDTYKLSDGDSTPSGAALKNLYTSTTTMTKTTAGGKTTPQVALELADAILGNNATQQTGGAQSFFNYTAQCVNWEPETYYARQTFLAYTGSAFYYSYTAAMNELNHDIYAASSDAEKAAYEQVAMELMGKAGEVAKLIGTNGSLIAGTRARNDGKVLCTVNNRLYKKASRNSAPALYYPLMGTDSQDFKDAFDDLLNSKDEDKEHNYSNHSTMSRSDYETMAKREAYVRTIPGYEDVWNIGEEFCKVGVTHMFMPGLISAGMTPNQSAPSRAHAYFDTRAQYGNRALVGDPTRTSKSDAASNYHKRAYSADMYDVSKNTSLGRQEFYSYDLEYYTYRDGTWCRWWIWLSVYAAFEMRAS